MALGYQICEVDSLLSREGSIAVHIYRFPPQSLVDDELNKLHIRLTR